MSNLDQQTPVTMREAADEDLQRIVELLADDPLGARRERPGVPLDRAYLEAFAAIARDPNNELVVAVADGAIVGVMQLTWIPSLTHTGSWRAQIEGVRVASSVRGRKIGHTMIEWAIDRARLRGCRMVQLTTDNSRPDALRFYQSLGFAATHQGLKLPLPG
jgi:ribosomal protein S18 acetylase RimI-like enzyme